MYIAIHHLVLYAVHNTCTHIHTYVVKRNVVQSSNVIVYIVRTYRLVTDFNEYRLTQKLLEP